MRVCGELNGIEALFFGRFGGEPSGGWLKFRVKVILAFPKREQGLLMPGFRGQIIEIK